MKTSLLLIACISVLIVQQVFTASVTQHVSDALDAAVQDLVVDPVWISYYSKNMYFNVPTCTGSVKWPKSDPFTGRTSLNMCFETGTISPWLETKTELAKGVVRKINEHYGTTYQTNILRFNTSALGFYDTLRIAVSDNRCDMITANVRPDVDNRASQVHFQCNFGGASKGWIRTGLDPQLVINDIYQLNQTGIKVGAYDGTNYATFIKSELTAATYVKYSAVNLQYSDVLNNRVHAIVGDAIAYFDWANKVNGTCGCTVKAWDTAYGLATFSNLNITAVSDATSYMRGSSSSSWIMSIIFALVLMIAQL